MSRLFPDMKLWAIVVEGVFPPQCVTVSDSRDYATGLSGYLNANMAGETKVQEVDDFYPPGMIEADQAWLDAAKHYRREKLGATRSKA